MKHKVVVGKDEDIDGLVLRQSDVDELTACCSDDPHKQLSDTWLTSDMRWTIWAGGEVAGVFGCKGIPGKFGVPWMLGSDLSKKIPMVFVVDAKIYIEKMLNKYNFLINYVHTENEQSIRWLKWAGYTLDKPAPFGEFGNLFHCFCKAKDV